MNGKVIDAAMLLSAGIGKHLAEAEKRLDILYKLTEGAAWDTETDAQAAYQKTVPSGAVAAEIGMIGGKTVAQDGEFVSAQVTAVISRDAEDAETLGTLEVPAALRAYLADKGYGEGAGRYSSKIEFLDTPEEFTDAATGELTRSDRVYRQRMKTVDLGDLNWYYNETKQVFSAALTDQMSYDANTLPDGVCTAYTPCTYDSPTEGGFCIYYGKRNGVNIQDTRYTDANAFKAAVTGVKLMYAMTDSSVKTYDISAYFTGDNMMNAEDGGTILFEQDGGTTLDVPNSVDYLVKLSEVEA